MRILRQPKEPYIRCVSNPHTALSNDNLVLGPIVLDVEVILTSRDDSGDGKESFLTGASNYQRIRWMINVCWGAVVWDKMTATAR